MSQAESTITTMPAGAFTTALADHNEGAATRERLARFGVCVAAVNADGKLRVDADAPRFFRDFAIPAINGSTQGFSVTQTVSGVHVHPIASEKRGNGKTCDAVSYVALTKSSTFSATDASVQRSCAALNIDPAQLAEDAATVTAMTSQQLSELLTMANAASAAEARSASLQEALDSLSSQLSETYEELSLIYQVSGGMRVNRKLDDFFRQACQELLGVTGVRAVGYAVVDKDGVVETSALFGETDLSDNAINKLQQKLMDRFYVSSQPILNNRLLEDESYAFLGLGVGQLVAVPILREDKILGLLFCLDKIGAEFTTQDSKLLNSIANETALYLENSSLFSEARGMMMGLMHALTSAVDAKDTYTCGHSQRVALFGREIAQRAGLSEAFCERVYMSGLLHDVGKIGVPEEVLRKPGKLTDEEFGLMKKHVEIGARILKDVKQIGDLIPGVLYHHERYDGKGYPHNLAGQDIPLIARILCVADCFDAMTSNRTYRKALPIEVALIEIRRCANTQFDPMLVDAFLSIGAPRMRELIASVTDNMALQLAA